MSAVAQHPEAEVNQLPLMPTAEPELVRMSAWGRLSRQAEVRVATDGSGLLVVQILQGKNALPFVAIRHEPADKLHDLQALAQQMQPGVAVLIIFRGFELAMHQGQQVLSPRICDAIGLSAFCFINDDGSTS